MDAGLMREVIAQVRAAAGKLGMEILATTSRRTPPETEKLLKDGLAAEASCRLLIIANQRNMEGAIPAFLGLCDAIIVSGESMSMISEAASSGRPVVAFPLTKRHNRPTRHENLARELNRAGYIRLIDAGRIAEAVESALGSKTAGKRLNDYEKIYNAVGVLL
jgi:mitochondrial fission protein ELM1